MQTTCFGKNHNLKLNSTDTKGVKPSAKCEQMNMSYLYMQTQKCMCMYVYMLMFSH